MARTVRRLVLLAGLLPVVSLSPALGPGEALGDEAIRRQSAPPAVAEDGSAGRGVASFFETGFSYQFESDIEEGGAFQLWEAFATGLYDVDMTRRFGVVTVFDYRADDYGFEDVPDLGADPVFRWGLVHTPRLEPLLAFRIGEDWRLFAGPALEFSFEAGANIRDGFRPGGLVAAEWTPSDDLRIGLGVLGVADLEAKAYVQPVLLLDWNATESLAVHMQSWTTRGGEIELDWRATRGFEIGVAVGYRREQFRLSERDDVVQPLPTPIAISDGLAEDRSFNTSLRLSYLPSWRFVKDAFGDLRVDLDVGAALGGRFQVRDSNDTILTEQSYDAAPSLGLAFHVPL